MNLKKGFLLLFAVLLTECNSSKDEEKYFKGEWQVRISDLEYDIILGDNMVWKLPHSNETGQWQLSKDTLILQGYILNNIDDDGLKDMKYIVQEKSDGHFVGKPYFGWEADDLMKVHFRRK